MNPLDPAALAPTGYGLWHHLPIADDKLNELESAIRDTDLIPDTEADDWISRIRAGDKDPLIALLLLRLPNLECLRLGQPDRISTSRGPKTLWTTQQLGQDSSQLHLTQLKKCHIHSSDFYPGREDK